MPCGGAVWGWMQRKGCPEGHVDTFFPTQRPHISLFSPVSSSTEQMVHHTPFFFFPFFFISRQSYERFVVVLRSRTL